MAVITKRLYLLTAMLALGWMGPGFLAHKLTIDQLLVCGAALCLLLDAATIELNNLARQTIVIGIAIVMFAAMLLWGVMLRTGWEHVGASVVVVVLPTLLCLSQQLARPVLIVGSAVLSAHFGLRYFQSAYDASQLKVPEVIVLMLLMVISVLTLVVALGSNPEQEYN